MSYGVCDVHIVKDKANMIFNLTDTQYFVLCTCFLQYFVCCSVFYCIIFFPVLFIFLLTELRVIMKSLQVPVQPSLLPDDCDLADPAEGADQPASH